MCNYNKSNIGIKLNGKGRNEGYINRTCIICGEDTPVYNPSKGLKITMNKFAELLGITLVDAPR